VRRELVTEANYEYWWGLNKRANGDVHDAYGWYGEYYVVYGRMLDGVAEPVEVGLFVDWGEEEEDY